MALDSKPLDKRISPTNVFLICIYLFANLLFIWKYEIEFLWPSWIIPLIYTVIVCLFVFLPLEKIKINLSAKRQFILYFFLVAIIAAGLTFLMTRFNPDNIGLSRFPAIRDWLTNLFDGKFPYTPGAFTSGFPFLFISAIPFYFLGDIGLYQIFSFVIFAAIIYFKHYERFIDKLQILLLLVASPLFIYEVIARSELFSNMVIVILYLTVLESFRGRKGFAAPVMLGLIGGLILSTRGIVLLIYIIFLGYMLRQYRCNYYILMISILAGFGLTLLPFIVWDWSCFIEYGPFTVQMWYCPQWLLALAIIVSFICGMALKSSAKIFITISILLFAIVSVSFSIRIIEFGFRETVLRNFYDISYYCLVQPFLLLSFNLPAKAGQPD